MNSVSRRESLCLLPKKSSLAARKGIIWKHHQLDRYREARQIHAVYEAGFAGFWLHDLLVDYGVCASVAPPSHIPIATGNRVKVDRRDSNQLSRLLRAGLLKANYVPTPGAAGRSRLAPH